MHELEQELKGIGCCMVCIIAFPDEGGTVSMARSSYNLTDADNRVMMANAVADYLDKMASISP